jgi:hypothetical protein
MTIPRSAAFMRNLVELAGKQATVQRAIRVATTTQQFELENKVALEEAFTRIASAARGGAVRMTISNDDFLNRADVISYMRQQGFEYTEGSYYNKGVSIEWWAEKKEGPKRLE